MLLTFGVVCFLVVGVVLLVVVGGGAVFVGSNNAFHLLWDLPPTLLGAIGGL